MKNRPMKSATALTSQPWQRRLNVKLPLWALGLSEGEVWDRQGWIPEKLLMVLPWSCQTAEEESPKSLLWPSELCHPAPRLHSSLLSRHSEMQPSKATHISWAWPLLSHLCFYLSSCQERHLTLLSPCSHYLCLTKPYPSSLLVHYLLLTFLLPPSILPVFTLSKALPHLLSPP